MKTADHWGHGLMALAAAMAALITGLVDDSPAWFVAAGALLVIWAVLTIFVASPSAYAKSIKWLEEKYEQTSPRRSKGPVVPASQPRHRALLEDTEFGTHVYSEPFHAAIRDDSSAIREAAANNDTDETYAVKTATRKIFAALGC